MNQRVLVAAMKNEIACQYGVRYSRDHKHLRYGKLTPGASNVCPLLFQDLSHSAANEFECQSACFRRAIVRGKARAALLDVVHQRTEIETLIYR